MAEKTVSSLTIRVVMDSSEKLLGENGLKAVMAHGGMEHLMKSRPEPVPDPAFTDGEYLSILKSFREVLGVGGVRAVYRVIGRALAESAITMGMFDSFKGLPPEERAFKMMELYGIATGRGRAFMEGDTIVFENTNCAMCSGATSTHPVCTIYNGFIDKCLDWCGITDKRSVETQCMAMGDGSCRFEVLSID